jgi:hypothetical protein
VQYELLPTLRNVSRTCGMLLGAKGAPTWQDLADLAAWWNALPDDTDDTASTILVSERETAGGRSSSGSVSAGSKRRRQLAVVEEVRSFRAPHGEEMLHRQHALLSLLPPSVPAAAASSSDDDNNDDPDLEDPISTSSDGGVSDRAGGGKQGQLAAAPSGAGAAAAVGGTGRSADPYDVAFPIRPDAKESELAAAAAMESGGGIKLTLEEAHNISAVRKAIVMQKRSIYQDRLGTKMREC